MNAENEYIEKIQGYVNDGYTEYEIAMTLKISPYMVSRIKFKNGIKREKPNLEDLDAEKGVWCTPYVNSHCVYGCVTKEKALCNYSRIEGKTRTIKRIYDENGCIKKDDKRGGYLVDHVNNHRCCHCFKLGKPKISKE